MNIQITEKALKEIRRLRQAESEQNSANLRIQVVRGGCSGLSYKIGFDAAPPAETDEVAHFDDLRVMVDPASSLHMEGARLDFSDGFDGSGFVFDNPNAAKTCGCGNSFSC